MMLLPYTIIEFYLNSCDCHKNKITIACNVARHDYYSIMVD